MSGAGPIHAWSMAETASAVASGEVTASAVLEAYLARIGEHEGAIDAFVTVK